MSKITLVGLDIVKNVFQRHCLFALIGRPFLVPERKQPKMLDTKNDIFSKHYE